jgi:glucose/arabinose dehydrogenase
MRRSCSLELGLVVLRGVARVAAGAVLLASGALLVAGTGAAAAATLLTTTRVASGLTRPVFVTAPAGDSRLFIVEQRGSDGRGRIKILKNGIVLARPFLTTGVLAAGTEQGLLGLAFAPDYAMSGTFYIHYNDAAGTTRLERHKVTANPDSANPAGTIIYSVAQPFLNHNGGWLAFGPDGYLWMGLGDGGSGDDPGDRAENLMVPLGKILRFDVSGALAVGAPDNPFFGPTAGLDEIWAYGLRNPWRDSFDRLTGDLIITDVGESAIEEIDFAPAGQNRGKGWNYGWKCYEGSVRHLSSTTIPCGSCTNPSCVFHFPAYEYDHTLSRCAVTGGYVYRGCAIPDLQGTYFAADYCGNQIYTGRFVNGLWTDVMDRAAELAPGGGSSITAITSFGEDSKGEMYLCAQDGEIFKIVPRTGVAESDMPVLRVAAAAGDSLGATTPGNALAPGIQAFQRPGSRIRGVGFLRNATIRSCPEATGNCLTTHLGLGPWTIDMQACVNADSSELARTFVFTNASATDQPLAFVDVVPPYLSGAPDQARAYDAPTATSTALLATFEPSHASFFVTEQGFASGAVFAMDVDSLPQLEARVASDLPLTNKAMAGPGRLGMALSFDFGTVAATKKESLTVVTRLRGQAPVDSNPGTEALTAPSLRVLGPMPFSVSLPLAYGIPEAGRVWLEVFDVRGRRIRRLVDAEASAGTHRVAWDGRDDAGRGLGAGIYFVRLATAHGEQSVRVVRVQ